MSTYTVVARDFNSPLVRNEIWVHLAYLWPELANVPQPTVGIEARGNVMSYFLDLETWKASKMALQKQIEADSSALKDLMDRSEEYGKEMNAFTQTVWSSDLSTWSADALMAAYQQFANFQSRQYGIGALLPLMDIGGVSYLESFLRDFLAKHLSADEAAKAFDVFTTPTKNSFSLDQEEDLLRLAQKVMANPAVRDELLAAHAAKHGWVYYVYQGPVFTERQFGEFLDEVLGKGIDPEKELAKRAQDRADFLVEKERLISVMQPTEKEKGLLMLVSEFVWSKPRRKDYQSKSYFHMEAFFREWARRTGTTLRHARAATQEQIREGLLNNAFDQATLEKQFKHHVVLTGAAGVEILFGEQAEVFSQQIVRDEEGAGNTNELIGATAFPGLVRGIVKIVNTPEEIGKMEQGNILVAIATTPSCVPAMKKAAAIVSDEGGLTCHAAIVSRELRVPCVVGTKIATQVLKDGDEVEVDATKGIVRKLS